MARDHFIPAALLGRFSLDGEGAYRHRRLTVLRGGNPQPYVATAEKIGYANRLYDVDLDNSVSEHGAGFVDDLWKEYEQELPRALDLLSQGRCGLELWVNVLVPFVASILIRDRHYDKRLAGAHQRRSDGDDDWLGEAAFSPSNLNLNRIIQRNGVMGRLLVSRWSIMQVEDDLCTSDLGYGFELDQIEKEGRTEDRLFLVVPLSKRMVLFIAPEPAVQVLEWRDGRWGREILSLAANQVSAAEINDIVARFAQDFVAGSPQAVESVDPAVIGTFSPAQLQEVQEYWPYRQTTVDLAGVWAALRQATEGVTPSVLGDAVLDPHVGISDRFASRVTTVRIRVGGPARVLKDVLDCGASGVRYNW